MYCLESVWGCVPPCIGVSVVKKYISLIWTGSFSHSMTSSKIIKKGSKNTTTMLAVFWSFAYRHELKSVFSSICSSYRTWNPYSVCCFAVHRTLFSVTLTAPSSEATDSCSNAKQVAPNSRQTWTKNRINQSWEHRKAESMMQEHNCTHTELCDLKQSGGATCQQINCEAMHY